jgi:tetratricopeptide (TPR) repeat protein
MPILDLRIGVGNNSTRRMPQKTTTRKRLTRRELRELDVKIGFVEGVVRRDPSYVEALQLLGDHYTQRGNYQEGLNVDEQLSRLEPANPLVYYNLACSYSLVGKVDRAAKALDQAIALGYRDFNWLAKDPDLRTLRQDPLYRTIQDKIRKMKVKVL